MWTFSASFCSHLWLSCTCVSHRRMRSMDLQLKWTTAKERKKTDSALHSLVRLQTQHLFNISHSSSNTHTHTHARTHACTHTHTHTASWDGKQKSIIPAPVTELYLLFCITSNIRLKSYCQNSLYKSAHPCTSHSCASEHTWCLLNRCFFLSAMVSHNP